MQSIVVSEKIRSGVEGFSANIAHTWGRFLASMDAHMLGIPSNEFAANVAHLFRDFFVVNAFHMIKQSGISPKFFVAQTTGVVFTWPTSTCLRIRPKARMDVVSCYCCKELITFMAPVKFRKTSFSFFSCDFFSGINGKPNYAFEMSHLC